MVDDDLFICISLVALIKNIYKQSHKSLQQDLCSLLLFWRALAWWVVCHKLHYKSLLDTLEAFCLVGVFPLCWFLSTCETPFRPIFQHRCSIWLEGPWNHGLMVPQWMSDVVCTFTHRTQECCYSEFICSCGLQDGLVLLTHLQSGTHKTQWVLWFNTDNLVTV